MQVKIYVTHIYIMLADDKIYLAGSKPGKGTYRCIACPYEIELENNDVLPICPLCGIEEYIKIE